MKILPVIFFACSSALALSCVEKVGNDGRNNINHGVDVSVLEPMAAYKVPVKEGFTTIVSLDGEQLAVTRSELTISVPAYVLSTRSGQLEISYSDEDIFGELGYASYWNYLSFEDTRKGDCDYNDVVLHCRVKSDVPWNYSGTEPCKHTVSVQPVALGGSATVGFGFLYRDGAGVVREHIVTPDIRRDLFFGDRSFPINTDLSKPTKKVTNVLAEVFECTTTQTTFPVVWFIQNGKDRLYAATTNLGADKQLNMINAEGVPYGIALTKKWCYPVEKCNIRKAYPGFDEWLRAGDETVLLGKSVRANIYTPATVKNGADGDLWDYAK